MATLKERIQHFSDHFKDFEDDYVIIGGMAAFIKLAEADLSFRATKDVDMVILTNELEELNKKIAEYIKLGGYKTKEATENEPRYYRFSNPKDEAFPQIIEIFARNEAKLDLGENQHMIPVQNDDAVKLSAILLDDEYFNLIKKNAVKSENGYSITNAQVTICLKARAIRELTERNEDTKKINKHRNDILKLALTLNEEEPIKLGIQARKDLKSALDKIEALDERSFKQIMSGYPAVDKNDLIGKVKNSFVD